jgi:O-acetyl-ADP-ribose deacetylase (regulator of RNase III)
MPQTGAPAVEVVEGDITRVACDALVNAANSALRQGGGVCGAIFRAAGEAELRAACDAIGGCPTGKAVITPAFGLTTARHIIHAVGPVHPNHTPEEARRLLRSAYASAIRLAKENGCRSMAFPAIGTGIYGYPLQEACREAVDVCASEGEAAAIGIKLVAFDAATAAALRRALRERG